MTTRKKQQRVIEIDALQMKLTNAFDENKISINVFLKKFAETQIECTRLNNEISNARLKAFKMNEL